LLYLFIFKVILNITNQLVERNKAVTTYPLGPRFPGGPAGPRRYDMFWFRTSSKKFFNGLHTRKSLSPPPALAWKTMATEKIRVDRNNRIVTKLARSKRQKNVSKISEYQPCICQY